MILRRSDVILAPTNNVGFGRTDESIQQLAIARLRAIEAGRTITPAMAAGRGLEWLVAGLGLAGFAMASLTVVSRRRPRVKRRDRMRLQLYDDDAR